MSSASPPESGDRNAPRYGAPPPAAGGTLAQSTPSPAALAAALSSFIRVFSKSLTGPPFYGRVGGRSRRPQQPQHHRQDAPSAGA
jgi:hypothetical protein